MIKRLLASMLILTAATMTGCASLPKPAEMRADVEHYQLPKLPGEGKAMVYVVRPSVLGSLIRFNVFVDNKEAVSEVGYTRGEQYIYFEVDPGDHQILSKAENWAEVKITANANDIIFIQQEPTMGIVMARNTLFKTQAYEGKYHVKHSSLGTIYPINN